jgi:hypothetical protein
MSTKTTTDVTQLRRRISELNDRVMVLENNLKKTQEMMQNDINRLVETVQKTR